MLIQVTAEGVGIHFLGHSVFIPLCLNSQS